MTPRQLEEAFSGTYGSYRIDGLPGTDLDTFFSRVRRFLIELLKKELRTGAVRTQSTMWIRFIKDGDPIGVPGVQQPHGELLKLAFNSRIANVYNLSDMNEIVNEMIAYMKQQIENPALLDSKLVFDEDTWMLISIN